MIALVIAVVAGALGYSGIIVAASAIFKTVFTMFLILFLVLLLIGGAII